MTNEEIKELEKRTYAIGWSWFPIDTLFNDIRDNNNPRFNKDLAYQDFKKIIDEIYRLKDKAEKYDEKETPKKPNHKYDECYVIYYCSNCKEEIPHRIILSDDTYCYTISYCPNCGQAVDWSDEDGNS